MNHGAFIAHAAVNVRRFRAGNSGPIARQGLSCPLDEDHPTGSVRHRRRAGVDPDKGGVEPLACVRVHTDAGLTGLSEVFRVPPGVVQATVGGPDTHFGRLLIGQEVTHPERLWQRMWDAFMHTNRRGWEIIILGALDVAVWDVYGQMLKRPVWELLGGVQRGPFQTPAGEGVAVTPYCTLVSDVWGGEPMFAQQVARAENARGARLPRVQGRADDVDAGATWSNSPAGSARSLGDKLTLMVDVGYLFHDVPTAARVAPRTRRRSTCSSSRRRSRSIRRPVRGTRGADVDPAGDGRARRHAVGVPRHDGPRAACRWCSRT